MRKVRNATIFAIILAGMSILFWTIGAQINENSRPIRLNFGVDPAGIITLVRPDNPQLTEKLVGIAQLPPSCFDQDATALLAHSGTWGRIAFGKSSCKVELYTNYDPEKTRKYYGEIKTRVLPK